MKQVRGDLWRLPADARCITTNGVVRQDGAAVMGRGVAAQAKERWPLVSALLGSNIKAGGNHVYVLMKPAGDSALLVSFPVKHHWREPADMNLIERSCEELMYLVEQLRLEAVLLPRPGCGNGRLDWAQVGPAIAPLLDDRISIVYMGSGQQR